MPSYIFPPHPTCRWCADAGGLPLSHGATGATTSTIRLFALLFQHPQPWIGFMFIGSSCWSGFLIMLIGFLPSHRPLATMLALSSSRRSNSCHPRLVLFRGLHAREPKVNVSHRALEAQYWWLKPHFLVPSPHFAHWIEKLFFCASCSCVSDRRKMFCLEQRKKGFLNPPQISPWCWLLPRSDLVADYQKKSKISPEIEPLVQGIS